MRHISHQALQGRPFWKYQALGNDYLILDPRDWPEPPAPAQIQRICDRRLGVGADGILWGPTPPASGRSWGLRLYNPDGSEFEKSGNGLRIFARYLWDQQLPVNPDFGIDTPGGKVIAHVLDADGSHIAMEMGQLSFSSQLIPVTGADREVIEEQIAVTGQQFRVTAATIGNPHCVVFVDDQAEVFESFGGVSPRLAQTLGPHLERQPLFPRRTNVQFVQVIDEHTLRIEIWERGAGYTLASGTSSCAAAGAAVRTGRCASPITVQMPGGDMLVEVSPDWAVRLTGIVKPVCWGEVSEIVWRDP